MTEKKGQEIAILDLRKVKNSITDFFVICSGNSDTQIDALANSVEDEVYKSSKRPLAKRRQSKPRVDPD